MPALCGDSGLDEWNNLNLKLRGQLEPMNSKSLDVTALPHRCSW